MAVINCEDIRHGNRDPNKVSVFLLVFPHHKPHEGGFKNLQISLDC